MSSLWVLIIVSGVYGGYTVSSVEFDNQKACEEAKEWVKSGFLKRAECFRKEK